MQDNSKLSCLGLCKYFSRIRGCADLEIWFILFPKEEPLAKSASRSIVWSGWKQDFAMVGDLGNSLTCVQHHSWQCRFWVLSQTASNSQCFWRCQILFRSYTRKRAVISRKMKLQLHLHMLILASMKQYTLTT